MREASSVIVAGHICLDIIPRFEYDLPGSFETRFLPGRLVEVGPAVFSTGGAVSNTGLILHKLGIPTTLMCKTGDDLFGQAIHQIVFTFSPDLAAGILVDPGATTSYTVIISPPGVDRLFLHCAGANDTFCAEDIDFDQVAKAGLFHFGYPPVMKRMYEDGGAQLRTIFLRAKAAGAITSLDMARPDPASASGRADWDRILRATLPYVDIFLPSLDELLFMLRRETFDEIYQAGGEAGDWLLANPLGLSELGQELLDRGVKMALIKLGCAGLYLRTAGWEVLAELAGSHFLQPGGWADRELWAPCFQVNVVGTTGSGDATIAGFLSALLRGLSPEDALTSAVAVGACNVEAADALSGVPSWDVVQQRIQRGWQRLLFQPAPAPWHWLPAPGLWQGPLDTAYRY